MAAKTWQTPAGATPWQKRVCSVKQKQCQAQQSKAQQMTHSTAKHSKAKLRQRSTNRSLTVYEQLHSISGDITALM